MKDYTLVARFGFPSEIVAIKGRLEAEGIDVLIKDELTVQVHNFYSNAIGGIRMLVKNSDLERAKIILTENGYKVEEDDTQPSQFWIKFNDRTKDIPYLTNLDVEKRFMTIVGTFLLLCFFLGFLIIKLNIKPISPISNNSYLTENEWCVDFIVYDGKRYRPTTSYSGFRIVHEYMCEETLTIKNDRTIDLPGFNSARIRGNWELQDNLLKLKNIDTLGYIYEHTYEMMRERQRGVNKLVLVSDKVKIHCTRINY